VVGACPVCCPPLRWVLAPCAGAPPRCCGPDRDHCYDRLEATVPHRIHSLAPCRHQGSGHPHAYGSCVRRAGMVHAVIHSPQQAFSQQSSGAAASRSRSHSSATNNVQCEQPLGGLQHKHKPIQLQPGERHTHHVYTSQMRQARRAASSQHHSSNAAVLLFSCSTLHFYTYYSG